MFVLTDGITDPRNFACLRSAASWVHGVIIPKNNSAPVNEAAIKHKQLPSSIPIYEVVNLARCIRTLKKRIFGLTNSQAVKSIDRQTFTGKVALVMGSEERELGRI